MGCGSSVPPPEKRYSFRLRVLGALNIFNNGFYVQVPGSATSDWKLAGQTDPYVQIYVEDQFYETRTVIHTNNPVWNEDFIVKVKTRAPTLKIKIMDKEVGFDTCVGLAEIPLNGLLSQKEREFWLPVIHPETKKPAGEIGFSVVEAFRTTVVLERALDLKPVDSLTGSSDVFALISIGQQKDQRTSTKSWNLSPSWVGENFTFWVPYGLESELQIRLFDKDLFTPDVTMGWVYHKLDGKAKKGPQKIDKPVAKAQGTLTFILEDDETVEAPIAPVLTEEQKKKLPNAFPTTCVFDVKVLGAYNLAAADGNVVTDFLDDQACEVFHTFRENQGSSDPFVRITCEGTVRDTRHINNTLEPTWNQTFKFVAQNKDDSSLTLQVFDHDSVSFNDQIGRVVLPLKQLKPGENTEMWSFLDSGRGELGLELRMNYRLKVKVVNCENLPAKDLNGMCDPYVKLTLNGATHETRVVHDNRGPYFDEDFRFTVSTLKNSSLHIEVWDSDLMLFKTGVFEDLIGTADVPLDKLQNGIMTAMRVPIGVPGKVDGAINLQITSEIPISPSCLDILAQKGQQAFNDAVAQATKTIDFIKTISVADFEKKQEAVVQPCDPKIATRPRFSRITAKLVGIRGSKAATTAPIYVGISLPSQGQRYKSKEYKETVNTDINEDFNFGIPSKLVGALALEIFESNKHPYVNNWSEECSDRATKKLSAFNDGDGLIRGSAANDEWFPLPKGGRIAVRVQEMFRFNIRVRSAEGIATNANPYIKVLYDERVYTTNVVPKDPLADRSEGIPGKPTWEDQFTIFSNMKKTVTFHLMDDVIGTDTNLGVATFDLGSLRRGIPQETTITFDKGGKLTIVAWEEEKMHLLDRVFDAASNAANLLIGSIDEIGDAIKSGKATDAVVGGLTAGISGLGNKIGGLF